ncbi:OmpA family protein [Caulobacter sp. KR2-114]|uniref:OmpA family protein n=1 Tax=Caulobacter sp. KR2-114 TaxID=3400912 RepID=UPI003C2B2DE5
MTTAPEIVKAADPRFHDAQDAKVACGIAIGFFKSGQVDESSIDICDAAYQRMLAAPAPPPPPPAEPPPPPQPAAAPVCSTPMPLKVYFGFDVDQPPAEAGPIVAQAIEGMKSCGWSGLHVVGHTDLSGSLGYNQALSERRAHNIADMLAAQGVPAQQIVVEGKGKTSPAVQTADGVKEPLNRRVEISVGGQ